MQPGLDMMVGGARGQVKGWHTKKSNKNKYKNTVILYFLRSEGATKYILKEQHKSIETNQFS